MTLREEVIKALGDAWTKELEDKLFWATSDFIDRANNYRAKALLPWQIEKMTVKELARYILKETE